MSTGTTASSVRTTDQILPSRRPGGAALLLGGLSFLAGALILPGPDAADAHRSGWDYGHLLSGLGFLLLTLGLPTVAASLGRRLGVLGAIGYVALMLRCVLSTGSHLYSWWIVPTLAAQPELHARMTGDGSLVTIYHGHGDAISAAVALGLLCLTISLWRNGSGFRVAAVLAFCAALGQALTNPAGLLALALLGIWLGLQLTVRGDVGVALRR